MRATHLAISLLCLGVIGMGATQHLGSPWPGVALAGLSLVPWALERLGNREPQSVAVLGEIVAKHAEQLLLAHGRIEEQGQQINSLRNAASLRGTLGG